MLDYVLLTLPCPSCGLGFSVYTELSNHHLDAHEALLDAQSVEKRMAYWRDVWLTQATAPEAPAPPPPETCHMCHHTWPASRFCSRCGPACAACATTTPTALDAFQVLCQYAKAPCEDLDARLLLDTLGVPPEAPAAPYSAAIAEAVGRWVDQAQDAAMPPARPGRMMWQIGVEGDRFDAHPETRRCAAAGCQPVEEEHTP